MQLKRAKEILIEFEGKVSPDIYGISIESRTGLLLIIFHSGEVPDWNSQWLTKLIWQNHTKNLSPDLFILQYGLNIVKNVRDDYSYYQKGL